MWSVSDRRGTVPASRKMCSGLKDSVTKSCKFISRVKHFKHSFMLAHPQLDHSSFSLSTEAHKRIFTKGKSVIFARGTPPRFFINFHTLCRADIQRHFGMNAICSNSCACAALFSSSTFMGGRASSKSREVLFFFSEACPLSQVLTYPLTNVLSTLASLQKLRCDQRHLR